LHKIKLGGEFQSSLGYPGNIWLATAHTERQHMNTWTAPLLVATIGTIGSLLVGEPAAALIWIGVALCGYGINRADNR